MAIIKKQFYIKGVENQKKSDITVSINRIDISKINQLETSDKLKIIEFLDDFKMDIVRTIALIR